MLTLIHMFKNVMAGLTHSFHKPCHTISNYSYYAMTCTRVPRSCHLPRPSYDTLYFSSFIAQLRFVVYLQIHPDCWSCHMMIQLQGRIQKMVDKDAKKSRVKPLNLLTLAWHVCQEVNGVWMNVFIQHWWEGVVMVEFRGAHWKQKMMCVHSSVLFGLMSVLLCVKLQVVCKKFTWLTILTRCAPLHPDISRH